MKSRPVNITVVIDSYLQVSERTLDAIMLNYSPLNYNDSIDISHIENDEFEDELDIEDDDEIMLSVRSALSKALGIEEPSEDYPTLVELPRKRYDDEFIERNVKREPAILSSIGKMSMNNDVLRITYSESELTGHSGSRVIYSFDDPNEVAMVRLGGAKTAMAFNGNGERRLCNYGYFLPFEVSVITHKLKNTINFEQGGTLKVLYTLEMRGIPLEKCRLTLTVKPI